jgi:uncharacterized DUF497 family protein
VDFSWDARKAAANLRKHKVSFTEAKTAFDDPLAAYFPDLVFSDRFLLLGYSIANRLLYVVYAEVREDCIRIISARKATNHEKARYQEG